MKNIVIDRCCANCEYSISPENEYDIMLENNYDEDDPTRPRAGDCCLGIEHEGNFVCHHHEYLSGGLETYVFYDDKDREPGYYVVDTYYEHVLRYFKLYRTGKVGKYSYGFIVRDFYPIVNELSNGISFEIKRHDSELFYHVITIFAKELNRDVIWDIDNKCFMSVNIYEDSIGLYFTGTKDSEYINIRIDNTDNRYYMNISNLFRNMAIVTENKKNDDVYKRVRKMEKK